MPVLKRNPDGAHFSQGDERAFFEWAERISCIDKIDGSGEALHLHIRRRRISDSCLRELIALFLRHQGPLEQLAQFENAANRGWFRNRTKVWFRSVFEPRAVHPPSRTSERRPSRRR